MKNFLLWQPVRLSDAVVGAMHRRNIAPKLYRAENAPLRRLLPANKITLHRVRVIPYDYEPRQKWREDVGDPGVHDKDPADLNAETAEDSLG